MASSCEENSNPLHSLKSVHGNELYLARRQLTDVPDLSIFTQLRYIWLNNNRIRNIHCHVFHCCLSELYFQNNEITSITGVLKHLHCLRVLLLHNNHLHNLEETVAELRNMQHLQTLNLFLNPFTQDPLYRIYTIHHVTSVQLLDRKGLRFSLTGTRRLKPVPARQCPCAQQVRQKEKRRAFKLFRPERQTILDTLAFGRRALEERRKTQDTQRDEIKDLRERRVT